MPRTVSNLHKGKHMENIRERQPFKVVLQLTALVPITVYARTSEEAEDVATQELDDQIADGDFQLRPEYDIQFEVYEALPDDSDATGHF